MNMRGARKATALLAAICCCAALLTPCVSADMRDKDPPRRYASEAEERKAEEDSVLRTRNVDANGWVNSKAVDQMAIMARRANGSEAYLTLRDPKFISSGMMNSIYRAGSDYGKTALIRADTMHPNNNSYQVRVTMEAGKMTGSGDLRIGAYCENEWVYEVKDKYMSKYRNYMEIIRFDQRDAFPSRVRVSARFDFSKLDRGNLMFYSYNRKTDKIRLIENDNYTVYKSGRLEFYTQYAGDILIVDRPLEER